MLSVPVQSTIRSGFCWTISWAFASALAGSKLLSKRLTVIPTFLPSETILSPTSLNSGLLSATFA